MIAAKRQLKSNRKWNKTRKTAKVNWIQLITKRKIKWMMAKNKRI